jgi:hypothetical protein
MSDIALHIDLSRAGKITGGFAVTEMGLGQDGQPFQTMGGDGGRISQDNHAVLSQTVTGTNQTFLPCDLDHTDLTVSLSRIALDMTQSRDLYI